MLYLVGLGLADEKDITVKGLEVVKRAERVYLESYTSILLVHKEKLVGDCPILKPIPFLLGYGGGRRRRLGPPAFVRDAESSVMTPYLRTTNTRKTTTDDP